MTDPLQRIGRLRDVDLREVWASEPRGFTPWLAQAENLQFLAESLDLPGLELVRTEHPVDGFSADIVAKIVDTDHYALIENQLDRTDHKHLGQVLTYAPRFNARVVIWIARDFTDAHRATLDWLNRITGENYDFFGVEVRAVCIGGSEPAPLFDVVAKPNDWTRASAALSETDSGPATEYSASNLAFWPAFHEALRAAGGPVRKSEKPLKDSNYFAPLAEGGRAYLSAWRSQSRRPHVGVYLGLYNAGAAEVWERLLEQRAALDEAYGEPLSWTANKQGTRFKISPPPFYSPTEPSFWPEQHRWLVGQMMRMAAIFTERVRAAIIGTTSESS